MTDKDLGKRIIILGCPGSGKSTLARQIHEKTGLPLFHLDNVWWKQDRSHISRDEFDIKLDEIIKKDGWIIDGDYSRTYEPRFASCDTVIFLDYSEEECMKGIIERLGTERKDIPWTENELDHDLARQVRDYRRENRPVIYGLIGKHHDRQILIFRSREETDNWISG
ncbi:MAG: AAA family ATPase [Erysipelotrichaceae bacterium]|nr:AAA family ATPase [Erysipelotrichaceae bacterium]